MATRDLFEQLTDALSGSRAHEIVRAWAWVKIVHRGSVRSEHFHAQFADAPAILKGARDSGVLRLREGEVLAGEWPSSDATDEREAPPQSGAVGTYHNLSVDTSNSSNRENGECSDPDVSPPRPRRRKKGDSPVRDKLDSLSGPERVRFAFENPRSKYCAAVIAEATSRAGRAYAARYETKTGRKYWPNMINKNAAKFREIAQWCAVQGISVDDWIKFVAKTYREKSNVRTFPSPAHCAGPWVMDCWLEATGPKPHRHAGHTYAKASDSLRDRLGVAGFEVASYDDDLLDWFVSRAKDKKNVPELYTPDADDEIEAIVDWLVRHEV